MRIKFSKNAIKFLNSLPLTEQERIRDKLKILTNAITESASIPFQELDIKNLKGEWKGYQRMRVGKMRIIFCISVEELLVYEIDFRGNIYKKK